MAKEGRRIGELLLAAGLVTQQQLSTGLHEQESTGEPLGQILIRLGHLAETDLTQILSNQLSVAWVSLKHVDFTPELLCLVPAKLAERLELLPVHFRVDREGQRILYVAVDDPTNVEALEEVSRATGMHVRPLIAPQSEIHDQIRECYQIE